MNKLIGEQLRDIFTKAINGASISLTNWIWLTYILKLEGSYNAYIAAVVVL